MTPDKEPGRPNAYDDDLFKQFVDGPITPQKVRDKIYKKYDMRLSWNTVHKYLDDLAKRGEINKRKVSNYHIYSKNST